MSRIYQALEKAEKEKVERPAPEKITPRAEAADSGGEEQILPFRKEPLKELSLLPRIEIGSLLVPPNSLASEEFRKLKARILYRNSSPFHSILVTSAVPQEGKTMVSVNLAIAISQEIQKKTILVDCDLRNPGIFFHSAQNSKGLSDYLSDQTPLSEILTDSGIENLRVIQAGPPSGKSAELISSGRMQELLNSLRESGDDTYIIIDSPPLIATSDPALLSRSVDGVILVVTAGRTPRETVQRAIKSIDHEKIIGVVLNRIDSRSSSYYSAYYHGYQRKMEKNGNGNHRPST